MTSEVPAMDIHVVAVEENEPDDCLTVAAAEEEDGGGHQLIVQIPLHDPDDQERSLGLDTYCLMNADGATHYGGIREAALTDTVLNLTFTEEARQELGLPAEHLRLRLNVTPGEVGQFATGLNRALHYGNPDHRPEQIDL